MLPKVFFRYPGGMISPGTFSFVSEEEIQVKQQSLEDIQKIAEGYAAVPVVREILADTATPIGLVSLVRKESNRYFLLESLEQNDQAGRYSFIGFDPIARLRAKDRSAQVEFAGSRIPVDPRQPLEALRSILKAYRVPKVSGLPPFTGGFVGYFSYDFFQYCEPSLHFDPTKATAFPDFDLMLFDKVIAFDRVLQKMYLIVNIKTDDLEGNYAKAQKNLDAMEALVRQPVAPPAFTPACLGEITSNQDRKTYAENVEKIKEHIRQGDIFQAVYSQRFSATYDQDLFNMYRILRTTNPSQYMVLLKNDDLEIAGSSPETLIKVQDREITSMPIAGTRRRGRTEEEDRALEKDLQTDPKELAEHNMLVDLARNDVGKVAEFGSVKVHDHLLIKKFSHVMHMTTRVTGTLKEGRDAIDTLCAAFPAGTLSGAPKVRACQILDELEPERRGPYGGGMGYLDFAGNMDICIVIRTAVKLGDRVSFQTGSGIVADSRVEDEFMETINKAAAVRQALVATTEA